MNNSQNDFELIKGVSIEKKDFPMFGKLLVPKTFAEIALIVERDSLLVKGWRGQSNIAWRIDCGAVRRVMQKDLSSRPSEGNKTGLEGTVADYEETLLDEARLKGYGYLNGRHLNDLELLAEHSRKEEMR